MNSPSILLASQEASSTPQLDAAPQTEAPLLLFRFGAGVWALPALAVREIHALPMLSPLPEVAPWVMGMFVLRGEIVPVLDLGARFGEVSDPPSAEDAVIVLDFAGAPVALVAREVCAVQRFAASQIGAPPAHGRQIGLAAPFVAGMTRWEGEIVLVLHLAHLLDFSLPALSRAAPRFDSHHWTPHEREILQNRALALQAATSGDESAGSDLSAFDLEASGGERRIPTAIFSLGGAEFAAPLEWVREFAAVSSVASVPCCPPHILGQINLRGEVITLLDVRAILRTPRLEPPFFGSATPGASGAGVSGAGTSIAVMEAAEAKSVSVVVFEHQGAGVGLAVDAVRDVLYLRPDEWSALGHSEIESRAGESSGQPNGSFLARGAVVQGRLLPLLDIARLLGEGGLEVDETV